MQTKSQCTSAARRSTLLPGWRFLAGACAGLLAIAAFAAGGSDQGTSVLQGTATKVKTVQVVAEGDEQGANSVAPSVIPQASVASGPGAKDLAAAPTTSKVASLAAPSNDDCSGAIAIPAGPFPLLTAPVDIADGENVDEPGMCGPADGTIWYSFTPSVTAAYLFSTCPASGATGSTLADSVLAVFESTGGSCPATTQLACNDTAPPTCGTAGFDGASISALLTAGQTYFVVAGKWSPQGPVAAPDSTIVISVDVSPAPGNDTCSGATPLVLNGVVRGTTAAGANDYQTPATAACFAGVGQRAIYPPSGTDLTSSPGRDTVHTFTAPAAGRYSIRWIHDEPASALRSQDPVLYASDSCPAGGGTVNCLLAGNRDIPATGQNKSEEIYCLPMAANQTVYVFFDNATAGNDGGAYDLEVFECLTETEPNDDTLSANPYVACSTEGTIFPGGAAGDIDFFSLGTPPAGSKVFAGIDAAGTNNQDFNMRVTTTTDTLQFDDNDGSSIIGSNAPVISGTPTTGDPTYLRIGHNSAAGAEPYHLYAHVRSGAPQVEVEPNNPAPNTLSRSLANLMTAGGYVRASMDASTDMDCFRFVATAGDDISMFSAANPDRVAGAVVVDAWPILFDLVPSGYNLFRFGGQVVRNNLVASPGTLTGTSPSITSEFWTHRARYTGTQVVCYSPIQNSAGAVYPLDYEGSITVNCQPLQVPAATITDLVVTKTGPAGPVATSSTIVYTVAITNNGPGIAQDIRLVDVLPPEVTLVDVLVNDGFDAGNVACDQLDTTIDCTNYSIAPGATTTWSFIVQVNGCIGSGLTVSNTVTVTTATSDPDPANNTSTWVFTTTDDGTCTDNDACTVGDRCEAGACVVDGPRDCDDNNPCTDQFCDTLLGCIYDPTPGTFCDDGFDCTQNLCDPILGIPGVGCYFPPQPAGFACNDFFACTAPDVCDGAGACVGGNACDDGNSCTTDSCDEGAGGVCSYSNLAAGTACDDGNACTTGETCDAGAVCVGGSAISCDDGNPCTDDACDPLLGCVYTNNTASCDDGNACTDIDTCGGGVCAGSAIVCNDSNLCTDDSCDPSSGCVYTNNTVACDDGNICTENDTCGGGVCGGSAVVCNDGNVCTDDSCDPSSGCVYIDNVAPCNDGNACTTTDICSAGVCVGRDPVVCSALDQCHVPGVCDPGTGLCSNPNQPDGTACDDDNTCTTSDACLAGVCTGPNTALLEPNPRTNGYYKRLCKGPHSGDQLTAADAACVAEVAPLTFGSVLTVADICTVLGPSQPNNGMCQQSEDDLMVLALNICKARVCDTQAIDSQCGSNTTVGQNLSEADAIFSDPGRDFDSCKDGKCLGEEINTGRALVMNSLMLTRAAGGGVTMAWEQPYVNDGQSVNTYKVWRREIGNSAFTKIATVNGLSYTDSTPGDFEYEVTAVKN